MISVLNEIFDEIYVINLPNRVDRLNHVTNELSKHNINYKLYSAITPDDVKKMEKYSEIDELYYGRIGCMESHRNIWLSCLKRNINSVFIFEDDIMFIDNFNEKLREKLKTLPNDWNFLPLGYNRDNSLIYKNNIVNFKIINQDWMSFDGISGSTGWGLKKDVMVELLKSTDSNNIGENFDIWLTFNKTLINNNIKTYSTIEPLMYPIDTGYSDTNQFYK